MSRPSWWIGGARFASLKAQVSFTDRLSSVVCLSVSSSVCEPFLFRLLLKNRWANLTKLGAMHPWVTGIQVCSNEGPCPSQRGDNWELIKIN